MTEDKKKKISAVMLVVWWSGVFIYYVALIFWLTLPLLTSAFLVPEFLGFLLNTGPSFMQSVGRPHFVMQYNALVGCGYVVGVINIGFVVWHYIVKRRSTSVLQIPMLSPERRQYQIFYYWVSIANFGLMLWLVSQVFQPVHGGHGKMGG